MIIGTLAPSLVSSRSRFVDDVASAILVVVFQYGFFLVFTVAVVALLRLFWRRWDFMRGWVAVSIGAGLGLTGAGVWLFVFMDTPALSSLPSVASGFARLAATLCATGALAGLTFWLIAGREMRPNNSLERTRER